MQKVDNLVANTHSDKSKNTNEANWIHKRYRAWSGFSYGNLFFTSRQTTAIPFIVNALSRFAVWVGSRSYRFGVPLHDGSVAKVNRVSVIMVVLMVFLYLVRNTYRHAVVVARGSRTSKSLEKDKGSPFVNRTLLDFRYETKMTIRTLAPWSFLDTSSTLGIKNLPWDRS